jgi:outer membrane protein assembly factor BamB
MKHVAAIDPANGAVLWSAARKGSTAVIPTPIVAGNQVYVSSGYGTGCNLFEIAAKDGKFTVEQVYANKLMVNHHGGVVNVDGFIFGSSDGKGLVCQNLKTGEAAWSEKEKVKKGAVSYADGMLYCRSEDSGTMVLVQASSEKYVEKGRFEQPDRSSDKAWAHPTIANGRLYLRDQDTVLCYDVSAKALAGSK